MASVRHSANPDLFTAAEAAQEVGLSPRLKARADTSLCTAEDGCATQDQDPSLTFPPPGKKGGAPRSLRMTPHKFFPPHDRSAYICTGEGACATQVFSVDQRSARPQITAEAC